MQNGGLIHAVLTDALDLTMNAVTFETVTSMDRGALIRSSSASITADIQSLSVKCHSVYD